MNELVTSTKNDFVKLAKSLKSKKARVENNLFLVEGTKCVSELFTHMPWLAKSLIVVNDMHADICAVAAKAGAQIVFVKEHVMDAISDCKTSQGIAAIASFPCIALPENGFILALDDVADPQNTGTMIRTADAAGCAGVVLSENSADFLSPKAVRASMGSIFHLPIVVAALPHFLLGLRDKNYRIAVSDMTGQSEYDFDWQSCCLVIGNEARGVSDEVIALSTDQISIPMYGKAESLNAAVAAGILIYKLRS